MHVHILGAYVQDIKFLWSNLWTGRLSTDNDDDGHQWQHTTDNSWLHRLICYQQMSQIYLYTDNLILYSRLGCWCKPQQCHGDVLVELVNQFCSDDDQTIEPKTETKVDVNAPEPKVELFNFDDDFPSLGSKPSNTVVQQKKISCQQPIRPSTICATLWWWWT